MAESIQLTALPFKGLKINDEVDIIQRCLNDWPHNDGDSVMTRDAFSCGLYTRE